MDARRIALVVAASAIGTSWALPAATTPIVEMIYEPDGNASFLQVHAGQPFQLSLRIEGGPEGLSAYGISVEFDVEGNNVLDVVSTLEHLPASFTSNESVGVDGVEESGPGVAGHVFKCEAAGPGPQTTIYGFFACRIDFQGGLSFSEITQVRPGLFSPGDRLLDRDGNDISDAAIFSPMVVQVLAEPGTLGFLGRRWAWGRFCGPAGRGPASSSVGRASASQALSGRGLRRSGALRAPTPASPPAPSAGSSAADPSARGPGAAPRSPASS